MSLGADDVNGQQQPTSGAGGSHQRRVGELAKSLTGIRGLDEITRGGLPTGRPTLVCGGPGSGKTLLALTFLVNGALDFDEPICSKAPLRRLGSWMTSKTARPKEGPAMQLSEHETATQSPEGQTYSLRLYVAGQTPKSVLALTNLKQICEQHLLGRNQIEIIDLLENPQLARGDQILAVPTLVRRLPEPIKKIIGDLSNTERVLVGLDLRVHQ